MQSITHLIVRFAIIVIAVLPVAAFAERCQSVQGKFSASIVPPGVGHCPDAEGAFCTAGEVKGRLQGNYEFAMTDAFPSAAIGGVPTILFFTGQSDIFLRHGDEELYGTDTGSIDLPPGAGGFASLITFTGGTGSHEGASGQIRLRGEIDAQAGETSGTYLGELCKSQ